MRKLGERQEKSEFKTRFAQKIHKNRDYKRKSRPKGIWKTRVPENFGDEMEVIGQDV